MLEDLEKEDYLDRIISDEDELVCFFYFYFI